MASVVKVNVSGGGVPKRPVAGARLGREGLEGDRQADRRFHGGPEQALCLFAEERVRLLAGEGYPVVPGSMGENVTTRGLDYRLVRLGDVFEAAGGARFQITKPRVPCKTITVYGPGLIKRLWGLSVAWGESGFYARTVEEGALRPGDALRLVEAGPEAPPLFVRKVSLPPLGTPPKRTSPRPESVSG